MDEDNQPIPIKGAEPNLSLKTLQNELQSICSKWFLLGVQLEIEIGALKRIELESQDASRCLVELLHEWLKNKPSWKALVEALRSPAITEKPLANHIEKTHCHHHSLVQSSSPIFSIKSPPSHFPEEQIFPDNGDDDSSLKEDCFTHPPMLHGHSFPTIQHAHQKQPVHRTLSTPNHLSKSDQPMMLSKELEEKFLPSIQKLREKRNVEREIDTHCKHNKILDRMYKGLSGKTSEEAQVLQEIFQEKEQQIHRLKQKLKVEEPIFRQAEDDMKTLRKGSMQCRNPIMKKNLPGAWRITSTHDGKLLATVDDGTGRVVLLERRGGKLLELRKEMIYRKDDRDWTPAGIALVDDSIFVGDAAGAVPRDRVRKELITATTDSPRRQGRSRLLKFSLPKGEQLQELQTLGDPSGMAFSRDIVLHVCDRARHRIWMLDTNLQLDTSHRKTGYYDKDEGHFHNPSAIDFDGDGSMYVLDQGNCRVQVFNPEFQLQRTFGEKILENPSYGIHVAKEFVYVTQTKKNCVSVFDKQTGAFIISFSVEKFKNPVGITVDSEGYIYVCDEYKIWVF